MNVEWTSALTKAVHEVFEHLCFMLPSPGGGLAAAGDAAKSPRLVLEVDFTGEQSGVLRLTLPDSMLMSVASAMLGEDGPYPLQEQYDAVSELANVVCGNVLPLIAGQRAVFDLAPPRILATAGLERDGCFDAAVDVLLDEGLVSAAIVLREPERVTLA